MKRIVIVVSAVILVVIAVGVALPLAMSPRRNPIPLTRLKIQNIVSACSGYSAEYGQPPASLWDLDHNRSNIMFIYWGKSGTNDGWGHPIHFTPFDASLGYGSVTSYGRDGRVGGTGRDADIEIRFGAGKR